MPSLTKVFSLLLVVVSALALSVSAQGPQWEYCSGDQYAFQIDNVDIEPYPIEPGTTTSFSLSGTSGVTVNQASIHVEIKKGFIPLMKETFDLCQFVSCPVQQGPVSLSIPEDIPHGVPKGKFKFTISISDPDYTGEIVCVDGAFQVE